MIAKALQCSLLVFLANEEGNKVEELNRTEEGFILHTFNLDEIEKKRYPWGVFRDRRPETYKDLVGYAKDIDE